MYPLLQNSGKNADNQQSVGQGALTKALPKRQRAMESQFDKRKLVGKMEMTGEAH